VQHAIVAGNTQETAHIEPIRHASISASLTYADVFATNPA
jgi:hypothetical protein